jgi:hypothetical protein
MRWLARKAIDPKCLFHRGEADRKEGQQWIGQSGFWGSDETGGVMVVSWTEKDSFRKSWSEKNSCTNITFNYELYKGRDFLSWVVARVPGTGRSLLNSCWMNEFSLAQGFETPFYLLLPKCLIWILYSHFSDKKSSEWSRNLFESLSASDLISCFD